MSSKSSDLSVVYRDITCSVEVSDVSGSYSTILSPLISLGTFVSTMKTPPKKTFYRLKEVSGIVRPGTMTMVISPPGHGKSSFLKALSYNIPFKGNLSYNGRSKEEAAETDSIDVRKLSKYCDQTDCHLPTLSVYETLDFAHRCSAYKYDPYRVDETIRMLGLDEARDTYIGDAVVRGVSGGQRRRVTIGEVMVNDAKCLFLDEFSNGLDTATSEDICGLLKEWTRKTNKSAVCALQQPTPGLFNTFDNVIILLEGQAVFNGPRENVLPFFAGMGFVCPSDVDVCDFIIDVLSQPRFYKKQLDQLEAQLVKEGKTLPVTRFTLQDGSELAPSPSTCVTVDDMVGYFKTTNMWKEVEKEIEDTFSGRSPTSPPLALDEEKPMYQQGVSMSMLDMVKYVFHREFKVAVRNIPVMMSRLFNMVVMGLIYGGLYYQIPPDQFFLRCAAFIICLGQIAFANMVLIPSALAINPVVLKQITNRFYPAWTFVLAHFLSTLPNFIMEIAIFCIVTYFMLDNFISADRWFVFYVICLLHSISFAAIYKFAAILLGSAAQSVIGPISAFLITFSGVYVMRSQAPDWSQFIYYISPYSWSIRALAINEFTSSRYDALINGVNKGTVYLEAMEMFLGDSWIGYAVLYLCCFIGLFTVLNIVWMDVDFHELSIGTRRNNDQDLSEIDADKDGEGVAQDDQGEDKNDDEDNEEEFEISVRDSMHRSSPILQTLRDALPFTPTWLSFTNITYTVQVQSEGQTVDRVLLDKVSGYAEPGKLTALMGASGAGKTTLLDVLAGRKNSGTVEGTIMFNGTVPKKSHYSLITGYVEQFDSLFAYDTVRETLEFAARLRLPTTVSEEVKNRVVDEVISVLDLTSVQNFIIGNAMVPGLSPSQLKRVNIGVELVANPAVLFLDEPTTGLDSKAAQTVMRVVKRIARSGRAIICTIHQPSAELAFLFDRLCLLGSGGHQIFFGDVGHRFTKFIKYLESIPRVSPCPARHNPASWMLEELGVGVAMAKSDNAEGAVQETQGEIIQRFKEYYFKSRVYRRVAFRLHTLENLDSEHVFEHSMSKSVTEGTLTSSPSYSTTEAPLPTQGSESAVDFERASLFTQYICLKKRLFHSYLRAPHFIYTRWITCIFKALLFMLIYYKTTVESQTTTMSALASRILPPIFCGLTHSASAQVFFMENRTTYYRERTSGFYQGFLHALSMFTCEMLWIIPGCLLMSICYPVIEMKDGAAAFFTWFLGCYTIVLVFSSMSLFINAVAVSNAVGGIYVGILFGLFINFNGIPISPHVAGKGWKWFFAIIPTSHLTKMLASSQFDTSYKEFDVIIEGIYTRWNARDYVADYVGFDYSTNPTFKSYGWIILFLAVIQFLTLLGTHFIDHTKR